MGNDEPKNDVPFVTERIKRPKKRFRFFIVRIFCAAALAVIFGTVAGVSFAFVLPYAKSYFGTEENPRDPVTIARDDELVTSPSDPSLEPTITETTEVTETPSTEPIEDIVQGMLDEKNYTIEDFQNLYTALYQVVAEVNRAIVTVISVENNVDWFNDTYESEGETSGLIYNKTPEEILILTDASSIHNADDIRISFQDGTEYKGTLRKLDEVSGMAVIALDPSLLPVESLNDICTATLGNSYALKVGEPIVAVGNPFSYPYSISYGIISSLKNTVQAIDCNYRLIHTNILESPAGNGFLMNLNGEIVGILTKAYKSEATTNISTAIAISDLKGTLERLSNGEGILYFGIRGQDVTEEITARTGLPSGIYVTESIAESPAYRSGIQNGDVITAIMGEKVDNLKAFHSTVEVYQPGEEIQVTVMRQGREGFTEIVFSVILEAR